MYVCEWYMTVSVPLDPSKVQVVHKQLYFLPCPYDYLNLYIVTTIQDKYYLGAEEGSLNAQFDTCGTL